MAFARIKSWESLHHLFWGFESFFLVPLHYWEKKFCSSLISSRWNEFIEVISKSQFQDKEREKILFLPNLFMLEILVQSVLVYESIHYNPSIEQSIILCQIFSRFQKWSGKFLFLFLNSPLERRRFLSEFRWFDGVWREMARAKVYTSTCMLQSYRSKSFINSWNSSKYFNNM